MKIFTFLILISLESYSQGIKIQYNPEKEKIYLDEIYHVFYRTQYSYNYDSIKGLVNYIEPSIYSNDSIRYNFSNTTIQIARNKFNPSNHKLSYKNLGRGPYVYKIDDVIFQRSNDLDTPNTKLSYFSFSVNGKTVPIPPSAYCDLYDPTLQINGAPYMSVLQSLDKQRAYVSIEGESAGYHVIFIFDKRQYIGRILRF